MSIGSSLFSDYNDLRDFDGWFGSQSTLEARSVSQPTGQAKALEGHAREAQAFQNNFPASVASSRDTHRRSG